MKLSYKCDMLIDQDRYIGKDPVGYKCNNDAAYESKEGYLFCKECRDLLVTDPTRLTFPPVFGIEYQKKVMELCLESIRKNFFPK